MKDTTVHVRSDDEADRVVFWADLDISRYSSFETIERHAMDYVTERFLDSGFVLGVNRGARLVALGRSVDAAILKEDGAFELVESLAREAVGVAGRLGQGRGDAGVGATPASDPNNLTFNA